MDLQQSYDHFKKTGIEQSIDFEKFNAFLITHHSTRLEGSTLLELETQILLQDGITPKGKPLEHSNMVQDHYRALKMILNQARKNSLLSEEFIRSIGVAANKTTGGVTNTAFGTFDDSKGGYRLANAFAGSDYFLSYDKIDQHMSDLIDAMNLQLTKVNGLGEVYNLAFDSHFYLVEIHPFGDGNGRTARLLMNYIQAWHGYPVTPVFSEDRKEYITALKKSRSEENTEAIREFLTHQAIKYFQRGIDKLNSRNQNLSFVF